MTGRITTTTVFDALPAMKDRLDGIAFPPHGDTDQSPVVYFLGDYDEAERETVWLVGKVPDGQVDWSGSGPSTREERYELNIRVSTIVAGSTGPEALARCKEITNLVHTALRDQTTGQVIPLDLGGAEIAMGGVNRTEVDAWPIADEGWQAVADIFFRVYARI